MTSQIQKTTNSVWNDSFNTIKIVLIILIIIGHLMSGHTHLTHIIKGILSNFRVALFFGVSGYLLKKELFIQPFSSLFEKYFHRLMIPYLFAYFIYSVLEGKIINPLYTDSHLWFIPAFVLMIFYTYIIEHLNLNPIKVFIFLYTLTFLWISFVKPGDSNHIMYYLGDKRYYYFFVFLYFGYILRNYPEKFNFPLWFTAPIVGICGFYLFTLTNQTEPGFIYSLNWLLFRLSLIALTIKIATHFTDIKIPVISNLGSITLPIYLWHMVPLMAMWKLREVYHIVGWQYLILYFLALSALIILIQKTKETKFTKMFITGERQWQNKKS